MTNTKSWVKFKKIDDNYGMFTMAPLSRGMGLTVGNALRRVLLSSLSGAGFTKLVIEGAEHEFATLPNVVEDVLDIIANIKGIVLKSHAGEAKTITLDFKGKGSVTAKDIKHDADIEIINPDHHIAELSATGTLKIELTVETGIGYSPSEDHISEDQKINTICIDASFSPIVRVNQQVENIRVGQDLNHDSLEVEVWTDGSVDTESAVKEAANTLIDQFLQFGDLNRKPVELVEVDAVDPDEQKKESALKLSVEDLELSARSLNCLKKAGIETVSELIEKDMSELIQIKNFGKKSAEEINEKLEQYGLSLKGDMVEA